MEKLTKRFSVFDCDAHINDYPMAWEKYYSESERTLAKNAYWNYGDHTVINGKIVRPGRPPDKWFIMPGARSAKGGPRMSFIDFQGPGMTKEVLRKLNNMDLMGIDQVLVIPISLLVTAQWIENAEADAAVLRAYNNWVKYDYCDAAPDRLFPCGLMVPQDPYMAAEELRRLAKLDFRVASLRPIDAQGKYPNQPLFEPLWKTFEDTGVVCGMHTVTGGQEQPNIYSPGQILDRAASQAQIQGAGQTLSFIYEAMTWVTGMLLSGFLERYPRLKMAIFESNATWLPMVLEGCDQAYHLYGNQRLPKVKDLPSETFRRRCLIAFESDEEWVFRRHRYFQDVGIWSSDSYHHDGSDAWLALDQMRKLEVPEETQAKLMGGNARRFYGLESKAKVFVTDAVDPRSIPRPKWFPSLDEIEKEYAHQP